MKNLFKHTRTYITEQIVIIVLIFVAFSLFVIIYTKFHKKRTNEKFADTKTEKESEATQLPTCQCPIQLPPAEWNDTRKTVQELVVKVNDMNSRLTPIETTFKSAENAESKQK